MSFNLGALSGRLPRLMIVLHDLVMVAAVWLALRWLAGVAGAPPAPSLGAELAVAVLTQGFVLRLSGLYQGLWRFASLPDLANLVRAALVGVLLIVGLLFLLGLLPDVPRRVLFPYPVALVLALGLPRLLYRLWKDYRQAAGKGDAQRVLVLGAGRTAETLLRDLRSDGRYQPVGLLDDNPALRGAKVQSVPVLGGLDELPYIAQETAPNLIVIAMPSATAAEMQRVVSLCDETGLPFRRVPRLSDMLAGKPQRLELSEVRIEDLLGRPPVSFGADDGAGSVAGKRVLVTGAGGSIGSELARQCAAAGPANCACSSVPSCRWSRSRRSSRVTTRRSRSGRCWPIAAIRSPAGRRWRAASTSCSTPRPASRCRCWKRRCARRCATTSRLRTCSRRPAARPAWATSC